MILPIESPIAMHDSSLLTDIYVNGSFASIFRIVFEGIEYAKHSVGDANASQFSSAESPRPRHLKPGYFWMVDISDDSRLNAAILTVDASFDAM